MFTSRVRPRRSFEGGLKKRYYGEGQSGAQLWGKEIGKGLRERVQGANDFEKGGRNLGSRNVGNESGLIRGRIHNRE